MSTAPVPPVVAGIDGSASSSVAVDYAARLAELRAAPLRLVCAMEIPLYGYLPVGVADPHAYTDDEAARASIDTMLTATANRLRETHPGLLGIEVRRVSGNAAGVLINLSEEAAVTVVGCRGVGGFSELMLGSVSAQLAAHGRGPVIVVRPPVPDAPETGRPAYAVDGPVIVGVDGSPGAQHALRFAVDEARLRGVTVVAVHAYDISGWASRDEVNRAEAAAAQLLAEAVAPWTSQAGVRIEARPVAGRSAAQTMIDQSGLGSLTVVGSRGRGGFTGLLLGSVSLALAHHANCPVAITHHLD